MTKGEALRSRLDRLLAGCPHSPLSDTNPRECPLHDIRELSPELRKEWARSRGPAVIERVLEYHGWCLARRTLEDLTEECWRKGATPLRVLRPRSRHPIP